jgi:hypothetical protein
MTVVLRADVTWPRTVQDSRTMNASSMTAVFVCWTTQEAAYLDETDPMVGRDRGIRHHEERLRTHELSSHVRLDVRPHDTIYRASNDELRNGDSHKI